MNNQRRSTYPDREPVQTTRATSIIDLSELVAGSACVGEDSTVPLGFISLTENVMMVAITLWMVAAPAALSVAH